MKGTIPASCGRHHSFHPLPWIPRVAHHVTYMWTDQWQGTHVCVVHSKGNSTKGDVGPYEQRASHRRRSQWELRIGVGRSDQVWRVEALGSTEWIGSFVAGLCWWAYVMKIVSSWQLEQFQVWVWRCEKQRSRVHIVRRCVECVR